ncbi:MAG: methyltransferase domain-containing protein [Rhodospirillaceae bacterium]|jgi:SAM-dependent methyltransferase|nr:methyltransferase domain-containing protein [Rhodospirillaceae bacterium]MBT6882560.1 methyltransferase domain-containing protein [Rhodospirillaceae bacterium]
MRETSVIFARSVFERHGLLGNGDLVLDVGGTPEVYFQLDSEARLSTRQRVRNTLVNMLGGQPRAKSLIDVRPNPLADLFPGIEYLDRGYNQEKLDTDQDYTVDFTIDDQVEHLADRFSMAVSFDTLEHVADPPAFCRNLLRVVKPGGYVYLQTVFSYVYHPSPEDYFRFSPAGLRECFRQTQGTICECDWEEYNVAPYILLTKDG